MDYKSAQLNIKHYFSFVKFWNRNLKETQVVSLSLSKRRCKWRNDATAGKRPAGSTRTCSHTHNAPSLGREPAPPR